jgi:hypothetical protein
MVQELQHLEARSCGQKKNNFLFAPFLIDDIGAEFLCWLFNENLLLLPNRPPTTVGFLFSEGTGISFGG